MPIADLTTGETAGLVAAVVSVVLAIVAIAQATVFYKWSDNAANRAQDSAKELAGSVERIQRLFDTFYSDTFSLMRDTYEDMRKHSWPQTDRGEPVSEAIAERVADRKVSELRDELLAEIQGATGNVDIEGIVERAISGVRLVDQEAGQEAIRPLVLARIEELRKRQQRRITALKLARPWMEGDNQMSPAFKELFRLRREGFVAFTVNPEPDSDVTSIPDPDAVFQFEFN